jgi:uncharacterized 2Fe-2S/4Fe-4S cluster protein (DUF4445 family)
LSFTAHFQPIGCKIDIEGYQTVLNAFQTVVSPSTSGLTAPCGGKGTCGNCRIRVIRGEALAPTDAERTLLQSKELAAGFRLACQTIPLSDLEVEIPSESLAKLHEKDTGAPRLPSLNDPPLRRYAIDLKRSTIERPSPPWQQIQDVLTTNHGLPGLLVDLELLRKRPGFPHAARALVTVRNNEIVNASFELRSVVSLGLAVDLGSTQIAGYLLDLESGALVGSQAVMNPQIACGEDIISRLAYALEDSNNAKHLTESVKQGINTLSSNLVAAIGHVAEDIEEVVIVGNTAMHHLLLGLSLDQLVRSPFLPVSTGPLGVKLRDLGLNGAPGARAYFPPLIAGFVGSDHLGMVLSSRIHETKGPILGLDIGTNTEIVLAYDGKMISCSCASGPAFEAAHIRHGMRAVEGAIHKVVMSDKGRKVAYETIGSRPPLGICGSGVIDAIAQLLRWHILDSGGLLDQGHHLVSFNGERTGPSFMLAPSSSTGTGRDLVLTQKDVNEIQLAKAALAGAVEILLSDLGLQKSDIEQVLIAGAFGTHLDVESAISIGMLPDLPRDRFSQIGNAAGHGAVLALASGSERMLCEEIARRITYRELTAAPDFASVFARGLMFPEPDQSDRVVGACRRQDVI